MVKFSETLLELDDSLWMGDGPGETAYFRCKIIPMDGLVVCPQ